jgi:hypothetical protein
LCFGFDFFLFTLENNLIDLAKESLKDIKDLILKRKLLHKIIEYLILKESNEKDISIGKLEVMTNRRKAIKILIEFSDDLQIDDVLKLFPGIIIIIKKN